MRRTGDALPPVRRPRFGHTPAARAARRPAVMGCGAAVDYPVDAVFDHPALAESYKVFALDAMNTIRQIERLAE